MREFVPWPLRALGHALTGYALLFFLSGIVRLFSPQVAFSMHHLVTLLIPIALILGYWFVRLALVLRRN